MNTATRWITNPRTGWTLPIARQLPTWLAVALALMTAWLLVRMVWLLLAGPSVESESAMMPSDRLGPSTVASVTSATEIRETIWSQFFGDGANNRRPALDQLPRDNSALVLVGVVAPDDGAGDSEQDRTGYVMIRGIGSVDQLFRLNDTLPDGRRIVQIETDRVVLASGGREEVLILKDRDANHSHASSPARDREVAETLSLGSETLPPGIGIASLGGLGQSLQAGQGAFELGGIGLMPVSGGGYRMRPSPEARWFAAAGLQVGDVLVALNGVPIEASLESEPDLEAMVMRVLQGERVSVTIERGGQEMTLQPTVDDLRGVWNERMQSQ